MATGAVKVYRIKKRAKVKLRLPLNRQTGEPYNAHTRNIFNKVFRRDVPQMGNCNWGDIEVLCWGFQYHEFIEQLVKNNNTELDPDTLDVEVLERWPAYPINATGDCDLTGVDDQFSYPNKVADARKELERIKGQLRRTKKALELLTGMPVDIPKTQDK